MRTKNTVSENPMVAQIDILRNTLQTDHAHSKCGKDPNLSKSENKRILESHNLIMEEATFLSYTSRYLRLQYGWTQQELADKCGSSRIKISNYENGRLGIPAKLIISIIKAFGIDFDEFDKIKAKKEKEYKALTRRR